MTTAYRTDATAGSGQSATVTSLTLTVPATAVTGDVGYIATVINTTTTVTTPTGWTLKSGPDPSGSNANCYLFEKTLASGDPGATVTLTFSGTQRGAAELAVISGGTTTGVVWGKTVDSSATAATTVPTLTSVPAGSLMVVLFARRVSTAPAADVTTPSGYTAGSRAANAYSSGAQCSIESAWKAASGSVGGESAAVTSSLGTTYAIAVPAASVTRSGKAKVWNGSAWAQHPAKVWTGSAWAVHPAKGWDGTQWVTAK